MRQRRSIAVQGTVQGVGFRPFVYGLACAYDLRGTVRNDTTGVVIDVEGDPSALDAFLQDLTRRAPPLARIERIQVSPADARGYRDFRIVDSQASQERSVFVPVDTATCDACLRELFDPADRRFRYPFLNCTHCGPRLTIIRDVPYDRPRTTMAAFPMCEECRREYEDPGDRRFHAQPTACRACGPRLSLRDAGGREITEGDWIRGAAEALARGLVVAVKGLGGYHLACDAVNPGAVQRLRERKGREAKPLAIMVRSVEEARELCEVGPLEEALLTSRRRPIVLLRRKPGCRVAQEVAPGNRYLGVVLPYTPLHQLLLAAVGRPLVMTSGNLTDEPIAYRDDDAFRRLAAIADLFLTHNRAIETRCDDSVTRVVYGAEMPLRRSRGYAPEPLLLPLSSRAGVLAVGGHLKNTFCLLRGRYAFLGHHIGDLENLAAYRALVEGVEHYVRLFAIRPEIVGHDLHPDYLSTKFALEMEGVELVGVQHHHAHVVACMAEHGVTEPVIGVAFDGAGYGTDGAIWGGEFLVADYAGFERAGHLRYVPLPGGDAAVRQPWRAAAAHLFSAFGPTMGGVAGRLAGAVEPARWSGVLQMMEKGVASPPTSSVGRLFDAVAAILGLRNEVQFEAQAAMELEMIAEPSAEGSYPVEFSREGDAWVWEAAPILEGILGDLGRGLPRSEIAGRFHKAVCDAVVEACDRVRRERAISRVALTGGAFQNALLAEGTARALEGRGFDVLRHRRVPPNDGGLSLGQAVAAAAVAGVLHDAGTGDAAVSSDGRRASVGIGLSAQRTGVCV